MNKNRPILGVGLREQMERTNQHKSSPFPIKDLGKMLKKMGKARADLDQAQKNHELYMSRFTEQHPKRSKDFIGNGETE